jgi:hypothetical protein
MARRNQQTCRPRVLARLTQLHGGQHGSIELIAITDDILELRLGLDFVRFTRDQARSLRDAVDQFVRDPEPVGTPCLGGSQVDDSRNPPASHAEDAVEDRREAALAMMAVMQLASRAPAPSPTYASSPQAPAPSPTYASSPQRPPEPVADRRAGELAMMAVLQSAAEPREPPPAQAGEQPPPAQRPDAPVQADREGELAMMAVMETAGAPAGPETERMTRRRKPGSSRE